MFLREDSWDSSSPNENWKNDIININLSITERNKQQDDSLFPKIV